MSKKLVDTAWLAEHLNDPQLRLFDCTGALERDEQGFIRSASGHLHYVEGHIPGADYLDLHDELSDPHGHFMFTVPTLAQFTAIMSKHGIAQGVQVILYSADRVSWATRVWWLLSLFGFDNVAIVDGGWEKWVQEERPISKQPISYPPAQFVPNFRPELIATKAEVAVAVNLEQTCIVNSLSPAQYSGQDETHYGRPGHIPSSINMPYLGLLDPETGIFLPEAELRSRLAAVGLLDVPKVVTYCGGGIGATAVAFALALVGREDFAVYDGSMSEWTADASLPVELG